MAITVDEKFSVEINTLDEGTITQSFKSLDSMLSWLSRNGHLDMNDHFEKQLKDLIDTQW
jgi:hypothetical protein